MANAIWDGYCRAAVLARRLLGVNLNYLFAPSVAWRRGEPFSFRKLAARAA